MSNIIPSVPLQGKHYVYTLAYPDGKVFYVGKGQGGRIHSHEQEARTNKTHNPYKCNVIRKIWSSGGQVVKTVIAYFDTHEDATMLEIALIFFLPDLTNITGGGDGFIGLVRTAEHRRKIADANRGKKRSPETLAKLSEVRKKSVRGAAHLKRINEAKKGKPSWNKGKQFSDEHRKRLSEARKRALPRPCSEETKRKIADAQRGRKYSEERIRKSAEARKGKKPKPRTEEHRRKLSEANKGKTRGPRSPESLRKFRETMKGHPVSEETRKKISEANKGKSIWTEEDRRRMSESRKGRKHSEETRHKMSESHKSGFARGKEPA